MGKCSGLNTQPLYKENLNRIDRVQIIWSIQNFLENANSTLMSRFGVYYLALHGVVKVRHMS